MKKNFNNMVLKSSVFAILTVLCFGTDSTHCNSKSKLDCARCGDEPKVICYFTSWAWYRVGIAKFMPSNINPSLCTHMLYAFASLDNVTLTIKAGDPWADIDNHFYTLITALKEKGVQPILSLGGWNDSEGDKYSRLVNNATARKIFISDSITFLKKYNFTGLDLDWEYPRCWQGDCTAGPKSDKKNFGIFANELRAAYKPLNLTLSAAVVAGKRIIDNAYDVPALSCALDWINVMTYDYNSAANGVTGANSPFYNKSGDGVIQNLEYWVEKGAKKCNLLVGVPFYGHSFTLKSSSINGLNAPVSGPGVAGKYTGAPGTLAYYEICLNIKNDSWYSESTWTDGTYAYKGDQWVSYSDVGDVEDVTWLVKKEGYGGAFIWALDYDDFNNVCGCGSYPLLTTLNRELRGLNVPRVRCY